MVIFFGDGAAAATPGPGLPPAVASAGAGDEVTGPELVAGLGFLLHIEKFNARNKGRIANRIVIKVVKAFKGSSTKNKCFCMPSPGNNSLAGEIKTPPLSKKFLAEKKFLAIN